MKTVGGPSSKRLQRPLPDVAELDLSEASRRTLRSHWKWWEGFCAQAGVSSVPPFDADTLKAAIERRIGEGRSRATVDGLVSTLSTLSQAIGLPCPTHGMEFQKWLRRIRKRRLTAARRQAVPLSYTALLDVLATLDQREPVDARDGALLSAAFDGMLRSAELCSLEWRDLHRREDGSAIVLLRRSKTDQAGEGASIYLTAETTRWIEAWRAFARPDGPIFHAMRPGASFEPLCTRSVRRIFRERGVLAGVDGLSGHSARVGAAQDATAASVPLQALMVAGRWKHPKMPARYAEKANAALLGEQRIEAIRKLTAKTRGSDPA